MSDRHWYLFSYDIRDQRRWRQVYKHMCGNGEWLQYSLFRCHFTATQMEALRWELEKILAEEDDLLIIRLAPQSRVIERRNKEIWTEAPPRFEIL